jgi:predicted secreted protein
MTKKPINGYGVLVEFFENGQWWIYGCARSASISFTAEMIETSVSGSGVWATNLPTKNSWSGTLEGLMTATDNSALTIADLLNRAISHTEMYIVFQATDDAGNVISCKGNCYFTSVQQQASFDNVATFNVDFTGTGALTQSYTPIVQPTPLMYRYTKQPGYGVKGFTDPALINKNIIFSSKGGVEDGNIVSGTPGSYEVKYVPSTGELQWPVEFDTTEWAVIGYQNL